MIESIDIRNLERDDDFVGALRCSHACFWKGAGWPRRIDLRTARRLEQREGTDRSLSVATLYKGKVVGQVAVLRYRLQVGRSTVKTAGIRGVAVLPAYRGRGLAGLMMREAHARIRAAGIPVSFLDGIRDMYHRYGYAPATSRLQAQFAVEAIRRPTRLWRQRKLRESDVDWMLKLHRANTRGGTGCEARQGLHRHPWPNEFVLESASGQRQGYWIGAFRPQWERFVVHEHANRGEPFVEQLLWRAAEAAKKTGAEQVGVDLHHGHPNLDVLKWMGTKLEETFTPNGLSMIALPDPLGALRAVRAELTHRVKTAGVRWPKCGIVLAGEQTRVRALYDAGRLRFEDAGAAKADLEAGRFLGQLILGHGDPLATIRLNGLSCQPQVRPTVAALFAEQKPYVSSADAF